ncbi:hypothetical protein [Vibrio harveyi]|uniref:hypothetical protein n=1 Tax=Vibrio harveyi TaxID=669 RepID=UPI003BB609AA
MTVQDLFNWMEKHKGSRLVAFKVVLNTLISHCKDKVIADFKEPSTTNHQPRRHFIVGRNHTSEMAAYAAGMATRYGRKQNR